MTIFAAAPAGPAAARIRGYSIALWAVGGLAIGAIIGLTAFSVALAPGGAILLAVLGFTVLGDRLQRVLDPKLDQSLARPIA